MYSARLARTTKPRHESTRGERALARSGNSAQIIKTYFTIIELLISFTRGHTHIHTNTRKTCCFVYVYTDTHACTHIIRKHLTKNLLNTSERDL